MDTPEDDSSLEALSDPALRARLARTDWEHDPEFVPNEQVFRLFEIAKAAGDDNRTRHLAGVLCRRLLSLARSFAVRSGVYPSLITDLDCAAEEISQFVWECLYTRSNDAAHAQKFFGQLFKRRALDFQKKLHAKKRSRQDSLDAMNQIPEGDEPDEASSVTGPSPEEALETQQEYAHVAARMQAILNAREHSTYVMLYVENMKVQDIATAFDVTPRTVNNYKNAALRKIRKEFTS